MLQLLLGRGGGTLPRLMERIQAGLAAGRRGILLVPEQYSHQMERALCTFAGNESCRFIEVLSFTRLANRVANLAGGLAVTPLDAGGRILVMQKAKERIESTLTVYGGVSRKPAFLAGLLSTIDELKSGGVGPEQLYQAAEKAEGMQGQRLRELALLYGAYTVSLGEGVCDPKDQLTRLAEQLLGCDYADGLEIYLYGFSDFTKQEKDVLRALLRRASSLTAALPCPDLDGEEDVFFFARKTGRYLLRLARERNMESRCIPCPLPEGSRAPALCHLETTLFGAVQMPAPDGVSQESVCLLEAATPASEIEWVAAQILHLVREKHCRFRDIYVIARGFESYAGLLDVLFARYGIPLFLSRMTDVLQKPVLSLVVAALEAIDGGYEYEDVFRYLKTGLTDIDRSDCDRLENYVLRWSIRGSGFARPWVMHPEGFGNAFTPEDELALAELNQLREQLMKPLRRLEQNGAKTAREQAQALYAFLEEIQLPQRLEERAAALEAMDQKEQAEEYRQLWSIVCKGLEQCVEHLNHMPMDLHRFSKLFSLVLSQYDVGSIPVSLDRVTAGEAMRIGRQSVPYLFWIGATDDVLPMAEEGAGLLKEEDRVFLEGFGMELSPGDALRLLREMSTIDTVCAMPQKGLFLSWPAAGPSGESRRPSFLVERVRRLLPKAKWQTEADLGLEIPFAAPRPALAAAMTRPDLRRQALWAFAAAGTVPETVQRIESALQSPRGALHRETVRALYGDRIAMSASRLDRFNSCHFAYFMQYGLKAKPRKSATFDAPEMGTLVHFVLEQVLAQCAEQGGAGAVTKEFLAQACNRAIDRYGAEKLGGLEEKSPRFRYLFRRLRKTVLLIVQNVIEELNASEFEPISFELGFGETGGLPPLQWTVDGVTLSISGFVDRVDGWEKDGTLYVRVVDYKTGVKSFDITEIWNGLGMQMMLYLFALEKEGELLYGKPVTPAGVLYLPARQVILQGARDMPEGERSKKLDALLRRRGLLLNSPQVLEAMEHCEGEVRFLPIRVSRKTGAFSGDALVTAAQFDTLHRHLDQVLTALAREMQTGQVDAAPWYRGPMQNACTVCPYAAACQFDSTQGDRRRYWKTITNEAFWKGLEQRRPSEGEEAPCSSQP